MMATMIDKIATPAALKHVQTTAQKLRDGFPYFEHHDSVSALWTKKWRSPCAQGIYPFTEANIEDFDPIFEKLVDLSGDDPAFLRKPDDYAKPFFPVAEELARSAEAALGEGRQEEARDLFLRASAVYRIARFPINRTPLTEEAWTRGKAAYEKAGALLDPPNASLDIPFLHAERSAGDREGPIKAYLRGPRERPPKDGWPVLLFICGLDAYRTDNTSRIDNHLRQGLVTLSFEIPGTGDCPAAANDPTSADRLMSSVLDWLTANAVSHALDTSKILARGISTGGYYAMRVAHTHANRLFAVVDQGGGCHYMFDPDWIGAQNQMEYPFALADALAWKFGYRDADTNVAVRRYAAEARKFSLVDAGLTEKPSCALLLLNGMEDSIFPIEDSFLVAARGKHKDLLARGDRSHMGNPGGEDILYAWIERVLAKKP